MITLKMADQGRSQFYSVYSDHSILECYNLFSGVELSMRSFFVICVVVTISLWTLELKQTLIGLLFHNMRL